MTDADGKYVIHQVTAGTFYVGISIPDYGGVDTQSPHATTYFPGTPELKSAKTVKVERAGQTSGIDFVVPTRKVVHTIRGTVRRKDGTLIPQAPVSVVPRARNRSTSAQTDAKGAFLFEELSGEDVIIRACLGQVCVEEQRKIESDVALSLVLPE